MGPRFERRKMSTTDNSEKDFLGRKFMITREFDAPRELVFKAWTDPWHLARWWGPRGFTNPVCEVDLRPGGSLRMVMRGPDGVDYPMVGTFHEFASPERLVFSTGALDPQGNLLFEFFHAATFSPRDAKTAFLLQSKVVKTSPGAGRYLGG